MMLAKCVTYLILLATWNVVNAAEDSLEYIDPNPACPTLSNLKGNINSIQLLPSLPSSVAPDDHKITLQFTLLDPQSGVVGSFITCLNPGNGYALVWTAIPDPAKKLPVLPPDATCVWDMNPAGEIRFTRVMPPPGDILPLSDVPPPSDIPTQRVMFSPKSSSLFWRFLSCCLPCLSGGGADGEDE